MLQIRDETAAGKLLSSFSFELPDARTTLREIITARVRHEVESFNATSDETFRGLVMPEGAERVLNGYRLKQRRQIDWQEQANRALEAFERNGFLVLIDDRQLEALDETVELRPETRVSFVRLVQLVGG